ncbi:Formyl-coenzyme A transferase [compost metagenome]
MPAAPIQNFEEALACEQSVAREMVMEVEHPVEGKVKMLGFPVKMRGTPQQIRRAAPLLGAHTQEVFAELGLSAQRIAQLQNAGAFGAARKTLEPA